jgi:hypothetical protein
MIPRVKSKYSEKTYRSTTGKIRPVHGWKVWVNGQKYPDERTYVYSQPNTVGGQRQAETMAVNDALFKLSRGRLQWKN